MIKALLATAAAPSLLFATSAAAQNAPDDLAPVQETRTDKEPIKVRLSLGPQVRPRFPGSDRYFLLPFYDVSITRGDKPFEYEAADRWSAALTFRHLALGYWFEVRPLAAQ